MKDYRKGNDLIHHWKIYAKSGGERVAYDLSGKDLTLLLALGAKEFRVTDFSVSENVITFTFYGKDQDKTGVVTFTLIENEGKTDMHTFDKMYAYRLVSHSIESDAGDSTNPNLTVETVELESTIDAELGLRGYSAYEIAVQEGFVGTEGEWLESLKGEQGEQGEQGIEGPQGEKGDKGDRGEQGPQGDPGGDAEVTQQNIERALGYVPASTDSVAAKYTKPTEGIPVSDMTSGVQTLLEKADTAYQKPSGGITKSDLNSALQTSLGKADTALQPVSGATNGNLARLNGLGKLVDSGKKPSDFAAANLVPAQASAENQLADKAFVNSTVQTATANFRGNWGDMSSIPADADGYPEDYAGSRKPTTNDYMVVQDVSPEMCAWDSEVEYSEGQICASRYNSSTPWYYFIALQGNTNQAPGFDTEGIPYDTSYWKEVDNYGGNDSFEGTWRFKYTGDWDTIGVLGWLPEYQVNEKPLTAAQLAALNSGITDTKVTKLDALPNRAELTQEEQALDKIFIATKNVTTPAQVAAAVAAGKIVVVFDSDAKYILTIENNEVYFFSAFIASSTHYFLKLNKSTGTWSWNYSPLEKTSNKVTSLSPSSTDTEYPSAKCVYDALYENAIISLAVNSAGTAFDLIGLKVTVTNADTSEQISEQTWQGSPLVVRIKAGVNYIVSVQSHPDYVTPVAQSFKSELASIRAITFEYVYSSVIDLSYRDTDGQKQAVQNTANSYIARIAGDYKFPAVYGNAIKNGAANADAYIRRGSTYTADFVNYKGIQITSPYIETDTGESIASAVLLWQTGANLISNVSFANGYVSFTVNSIPTENGLAVLAVKDASGDIMWSWTIWLSTDTLTAEKFTNYTEVDYYLMPENLFCIWNEQRTNCGTGMIQWGRKDVTVPNAPGDSSQMTIYDIDGNTITPGTALGSVIGVFGTDNDQSADKTVANSIKNPGMFFTRYDSTNNNWNNLAWFNNFWNAAETSSASSADNQDTAIKTIYDPCPFGWMLPAGRAFTGFTTTGGGAFTASQFNVVGSWSNGWNFKRNSEDATGNKFIASGLRASGSGAFEYVGSNGYYWSFAPFSQVYASYLYFRSGYVGPQHNNNRSNGFAVRPSRELE